MKWLPLFFSLGLYLVSASYDILSPADRKALQAGTFPAEIFYVIIGSANFSDLQKWILVSKQTKVLALDIFLLKYGRLALPHRSIEPHLSKMLTVMKDNDLDPALTNFVTAVDKRLLLSVTVPDMLCLLDPSSLFSNHKIVSALPFHIAELGKGAHKEILLQLIEAQVYQDLVQPIIPFVDEEISEDDVFKAISCGASLDTVKALVAKMNPDVSPDGVMIGFTIFNSEKVDGTLQQSLLDLKTIPTPLLCLLADQLHEELLELLVTSRVDIKISGHQFWFKVGQLRNQVAIAECLMKNKENIVGAMLILDPASVHDLLRTRQMAPEALRVAPLVVKAFLSTKKHHGPLLSFFMGKSFVTHEVFDTAAINGANAVVLDKIFHSTISSSAQISKSIQLLLGMPNMSQYITLWLVRISPHCIFKIVQTLMKSRDMAKLQFLVQAICKTSWHINYAKMLLEQTYSIPECRAVVLEWIGNSMREAKKEIANKFDMIEDVLCCTLAYFGGKATLGPITDLRNHLVKTFGLETILEFCTERHLATESTASFLQFLPAYLHPFLPSDRFKALAKKVWKFTPIIGVRYSIDFNVPPSDIDFLLHGIKGKPLLDLVLYVVSTENAAYIDYFSWSPKVIKNMKVLAEYVLRCPSFCAQTFMRLDRAFKFANQEPRNLVHVCLAKSIPEPIVRHIISKYQFQKRLSVHVVYHAALNAIYSDDFIALLISHCQFEQFAGKLVNKLEEGKIKRGEGLIMLLRQMASEASRLPSRLSPKHF